MNPNLLILAGRTVAAGAHLLVQSTLLILAGLVLARVCRRRGPALESVILRATLVAVILCPLLSVLLGRLGIQGRSLELPAASVPAMAPAGSAPATMPTISVPLP